MSYTEEVEGKLREAEFKKVAKRIGLSGMFVGAALQGKRKISLRLAWLLEKHFKIDGLKLLSEQLVKEWESFKKNNR